MQKVLDQGTGDKEDVKRAPFDLKSQMISEITELLSRDSHSQMTRTPMEQGNIEI